LGRVPGRCSFNDGFDPALVLGSYCGSLKLLCDGAPPDLGGGGCYQRRRGRGMAVAFADEHGAQGSSCALVFSSGFCASLLRKLSLFPVTSYLYAYESMYVFLI
jgi:hypothetical protein